MSNLKKRNYLLPAGCKDLIDALHGKPPKIRRTAPRVNGNIRATKVSVIGQRGRHLGIMPLGEALNLAQSRCLDLVEIKPDAKPPICRIMDYGKFRFLDIAKLHYESTKRGKKDV
jgi:translation initiation factor IF-3